MSHAVAELHELALAIVAAEAPDDVFAMGLLLV
jgi:hypothetical protein